MGVKWVENEVHYKTTVCNSCGLDKSVIDDTGYHFSWCDDGPSHQDHIDSLVKDFLKKEGL